MGKRGEGWVIGQFLIAAAIIAAAIFTGVDTPLAVRLVGTALILFGIIVIFLGALHLGKNLTPFPKPKDDAHALVTGGIYNIVRHPIYSGFATAALGGSVYCGTLPGVALTIFLFVWFDLKARREEAWLLERYPAYAAYQARVKKLIPFIY